MNVKNGHWGPLQLGILPIPQKCVLYMFCIKKIAFNKKGFLQIFSFSGKTKRILTKFLPNVNFVSKYMYEIILKTIPCFGKKNKYEVLFLTINQL